MRIRSAIDYPLVSAAASVLIDGGEQIAAVRVVLGGVGPAPLLLTGAPEALVGRPLRSVDLDDVARGITKGTHMVDNLPVPASYRKRVAPVFVKRALQAALESASKRKGA
jgi:CO/xanthine dehydrogenase FAD-binding subunit